MLCWLLELALSGLVALEVLDFAWPERMGAEAGTEKCRLWSFLALLAKGRGVGAAIIACFAIWSARYFAGRATFASTGPSSDDRAAGGDRCQANVATAAE